MRASVRIGVTAPMLLLTSVLLGACEPVDPVDSVDPGVALASPGASATALPTTPASSPTPSPVATATATATPSATTAPTTPPPATRTSPLPFDLPSPAALRSSKKLVFAHYFTPYPISLDNMPSESDYYTRNYLSPDGENGAFKSVGGLLRERPLPRAPLPGDYVLQDMKTEVKRAADAGIDGFAIDILEYSGRNWDYAQTLIKAAEQTDPGFKIMLEPDMTALPGDQAALTKAITTLAASPSVYRLAGGRLVVAPFAAEQQSVSWWIQWQSSMKAAGTTTAFVPIFVDYSAAASYEPISYGLSTWGSRTPLANKEPDPAQSIAQSKGKIWMQPIAAQDVRPRSGVYTEAQNTENLRVSWAKAISSGADWVQIPTWNDYSEGTEIAPSTHIGYVYLDLCSYYLTWFKIGAAPALTKDVAYLTNRVQFAAMKPTAQTSLMTPMAGSGPPRDLVEVLSFMTAPGTAVATVGGQEQSYSAPAGVSAKLFPLAPGTVGVAISRGQTQLGSVTSPYPVKTTAPTQDLLYYAVSTSRAPV